MSHIELITNSSHGEKSGSNHHPFIIERITTKNIVFHQAQSTKLIKAYFVTDA